MSKLKKILISIALVVVVLITAVLGVGGNYLYNLALNPNTSKDLIFGSDEDEEDVVVSTETSGVTNITDEQWLLEKSNYEDLYMTSKDGLKLHNYLINNGDSNKWAITVHGYTSEGYKTASYARRFHEMGYNVLVPDLMSHGTSEGDYIGMGWDERYDIIDLINYIVEKDSDAEIVLFGVSMGAATVMNVSGEELPTNVKAIVEDCGYTSVWDEFAYQLNDLFGLPPFPMMHISNMIAKVKAGYSIKEAAPIKQIAKSKTPTLFIHGDEDDFVPYFMLDELYNAANVEKEKLIIKGAGHAKASDVDPKLYWETVNSFLNKYVN
ncbi:alpha/beta hydrolase [Clostridium sp.]|uniref:alpha/beta hydrolase n=1 Tax=Clostridium sp. TaxID=1506 RepID=UPI003F3FC235